MSLFPYLYQSGFETGAVETGGILTDTTSKSSYPHYSESIPKFGITPWRGAYCWVIDQSTGTGTTDCYITVAGANVTADYYWSMGFAFFAKSTVMANTNRTTLVQLANSGTDEVCLQLYYTTAGGLQLLLTEAYDTAVGSNPVCPLVENQWHWIELYGTVDDGGSDDGTAYLVLDGNAIGSLSALDQGAITDMLIGLDDIDAGHTAGIYAFDDILFSGIDTSEVRIGHRRRYPLSPHTSAVASSSYGEHICVGPCTIQDVSILTANAGDMIRLYDTDTGVTTGTYPLVEEVAFSSGLPVNSNPIKFERGCYSVITAAGANGARGLVRIHPDPPCGYPVARCYGNEANLKYLAAHRGRRGGNR